MSDGEANGNTHGEMDSGGEMGLSAGVGAGCGLQWWIWDGKRRCSQKADEIGLSVKAGKGCNLIMTHSRCEVSIFERKQIDDLRLGQCRRQNRTYVFIGAGGKKAMRRGGTKKKFSAFKIDEHVPSRMRYFCSLTSLETAEIKAVLTGDSCATTDGYDPIDKLESAETRKAKQRTQM